MNLYPRVSSFASHSQSFCVASHSYVICQNKHSLAALPYKLLRGCHKCFLYNTGCKRGGEECDTELKMCHTKPWPNQPDHKKELDTLFLFREGTSSQRPTGTSGVWWCCIIVWQMGLKSCCAYFISIQFGLFDMIWNDFDFNMWRKTWFLVWCFLLFLWSAFKQF